MMHVGGYHEYIGDVQYIGGIPSCMCRISWCIGDVQYIGGIP